MGLAEIATLAENTDFRRRVKAALSRVSLAISKEPVVNANYRRWHLVTGIMNDPEAWTSRVCWFVAATNVIQNQYTQALLQADVTDQAILLVVENLWSSLAGQYGDDSTPA
jgi:hypothetical protein